MRFLKSSLLASAAAFVAVGAAHAADLPVKKAVPIEYVRVCGAYGAGFFYIPGTDTCLRLSGRARFEGGYQASYTRQAGTNAGDTSGYQGRMRINLDARTQTAYGTLRAFVRLDAGARTGYSGVGQSGTQQRIGQAYAGIGTDSFGRDSQFVNVDKAFIQFAGLTAGRASSFFDFYAHDFEISAATAGSDIASTNLLAYTATVGDGLVATISIEDPVFRRTPIFSPFNVGATVSSGSVSNFGVTNQPTPVFVGYTNGIATRYGNVDSIERERLPDFVGALRLDQAWGSAQLSAATHELNVGNLSTAASTGTGNIIAPAHTSNVQGWAVQGGIKINTPFIAPGDSFYIQGAYADGAQLYTGYSNYTGSYTQSTTTIQGQKFAQYFSDASINPFTGQLQTSTSFSAVASYLHYWTPEWRSAFFGSYGEQSFSNGARLAQGAAYTLVSGLAGSNPFGSNAVGTPGTRFYQLSQALRDTYQFVAGASLIWSPVKDLDIGVEGFYTQIGLKSGRAIDLDKSPTAYANIAAINAGTFAVATASKDSVSQVRFRVQRDF
ncbi:porin [Methylobacterium sp. J-048]|uniref:porin n=1 Tax=Methylobacterium sp. J-048 TaxID=2836635 RepID=UPI001FBB32C6|nr:porin [Methylobacterium sp. J-048]MCJ2058783.1 porin [Methylobacterium sp. J-048]